MQLKNIAIGALVLLPLLSAGVNAAVSWTFTDASGSYNSGGINVTLTAWSENSGSTIINSTGDLASFTGGLGIERSGESDPQHAIDNSGPDEFLVASFSTAVSLQGFSFGWVSSGRDYDATVLAWDPNGTYAGAETATGLAGKTIASLTGPGDGWTAIGHYRDSNTTTKDISTQTQTVYSSHWIIGARLNSITATSYGTNSFSGNDYFKLASVTVNPKNVPAPAPLALIGLGLILLRGKSGLTRK